MDVVCENCDTRAAINPPSPEQLDEGLQWLCDECGHLNAIGGDT